jgi:hypothetical protein
MRSPLITRSVTAMLGLSCVMSFGFSTIANAVSPKVKSTTAGSSLHSTTASGSTTGSRTTGSATTGSSTAPAKGSSTTASAPSKLAKLMQAGDALIAPRIISLQKADQVIASDKNLKPQDAQILTSQINGEISSMMTLKTQLGSETNATAAAVDVHNVILNYRVYLLVLPKAALVRLADDEQVTEANLKVIAQKLGTRVSSVTDPTKKAAMVAALATMNADLTKAQGSAMSIEMAVINLTASDYDANTSVLKGDFAQLSSAHQLDVAARAAGVQAVSELSS